MSNFDSWVTSTGLIDDFDFDITEAWFATDARIRNGEVLLLHLKGQATTSDGEVEPEHEEMLGCGPGWESLDGGKTARHESGRPKAFNKQTAYGVWIDRCIDLGVGDTLRSRGDATDAKVWVGLSFHCKREVEKRTIKGEEVEYTRLAPTEFKGVSREGEGGETTAAPAQAKQAPAAESNGAANPVLMAKLKNAAAKAGSHEEFVDSAMEIAGVVDDDALLARVVDDSGEGLYAELRG